MCTLFASVHVLSFEKYCGHLLSAPGTGSQAPLQTDEMNKQGGKVELPFPQRETDNRNADV